MHGSIPVVLATVLLTASIPTDRTFAAGGLVVEPPSVAVTSPVFVDGFLVPNHPILTGSAPGQSESDREEAIVAAQNAQEQAAVQESYTLSSIQQYARQQVDQTWGDGQWEDFSWIVNEESGWNPKARNGAEGACGLPQALPCSKLPEGINTPPDQQIDWMVSYIKSRYGDPIAAKQAHLVQGWY